MAETPEKSEDQNGLDSPKKSEERTQDYKSLIDYGLDTKVAGRLDDIYKTGTYLLHFELNCVRFLSILALLDAIIYI
jgi:hypothetical protein